MVGVSIAIAVSGLLTYRHRVHEQLADIRNTVNAFADASDAADTKTMLTLMCDDEAAEFSDGMAGTDTGGPITPGTRPPVYVSDIEVNGDEASATVSRPPAPTVTVKLTREDGVWRLCNPG